MIAYNCQGWIFGSYFSIFNLVYGNTWHHVIAPLIAYWLSAKYLGSTCDSSFNFILETAKNIVL